MVLATNNLVLNFVQQMSTNPDMPLFPFKQTFAILSGIGALYGLLCSLFAVRVPLRGQ